MKTAVDGILHQFRELGGVLAVALCDEDGRLIAAAGDGDATVALGSAVAKLLRAPDLFDEADEYTVLRDGPSTVSLHVRRVGEDWTLAAVWNEDCDADAVTWIRRYAGETAERLQNVC